VPRYAHAVLGGTFDRLHVRHAALLAAAARAGRRVSVGVTTEAFLRTARKPGAGAIAPFSVRAAAVRRWMSRHFPGRPTRVVPLDDRFGRSTGSGVSVLVVSAETVRGARAVNAERRRRGRPAIPVIVVPVVLAQDLGPVSSRRIRAGEIDRAGRRRSALVVAVTVTDPGDASTVADAVRRAMPAARIVRVPPPRSRRPGTAVACQRMARTALGRCSLAVAVARRPRGGWYVTEGAPGVALRPRAVPPGPPTRLARAVERFVRPQAL